MRSYKNQALRPGAAFREMRASQLYAKRMQNANRGVARHGRHRRRMDVRWAPKARQLNFLNLRPRDDSNPTPERCFLDPTDVVFFTFFSLLTLLRLSPRLCFCVFGLHIPKP